MSKLPSRSACEGRRQRAKNAGVMLIVVVLATLAVGVSASGRQLQDDASGRQLQDASDIAIKSPYCGIQNCQKAYTGPWCNANTGYCRLCGGQWCTAAPVPTPSPPVDPTPPPVTNPTPSPTAAPTPESSSAPSTCSEAPDKDTCKTLSGCAWGKNPAAKGKICMSDDDQAPGPTAGPSPTNKPPSGTPAPSAGPSPTTKPPAGGGGGGGGNEDLDPNEAPSGNFDLRFWKLTLNDSREVKDELSESAYEYAGQFFTGDDGAMVFRNPSAAGKPTSSGTKYTRVELREMLRGSKKWWDANGDGGKYPKTFSYRNNWVFGSASSDIKSQSGGVNGIMTATLKVDRVSTETAIEEYKVGRIVIGQIHAKGDEPIRLYYHKLPGNRYAGIYYAHEPTNGKPEQWMNLIGNYVDESKSGGNLIPFGDISDDSGIELGEEFGYKIEVNGDMLYVTIYDKEGNTTASDDYDMSDSGYTDLWMYFKAGCYSQNVATKVSDYDQVSFYKLDVTHENMKT